MPIIVYKAHSRDDLDEMQQVLSKHGIDSAVVGNPGRNWGYRLYYIADLAVDGEHADRARQIISEYQSSEDARIAPLTKPIHHGIIRIIMIVGSISIGLLIVAPKLLKAVIPYVIVAGALALWITPYLKSMERSQQDRSQQQR
jgi:hypothetical protein